MAQIEGSSNTRMRAVRAPYGSPAIRWFQESTAVSSKLIREGDPVCFDTVVTTALRIVIAPSSQGAAGTVLENGITSFLGIAAADSTSDGSTAGLGESTTVGKSANRMIPVYVADGLTEFSINISSVGGQPLAVCSSLIGRQFAVLCVRSAVGQRGNHGVWFLDSTNSTAADQSFVVTDVPSESIGDTGGVVYGKFLSTMVSRAVRVGGPVT